MIDHQASSIRFGVRPTRGRKTPRTDKVLSNLRNGVVTTRIKPGNSYSFERGMSRWVSTQRNQDDIYRSNLSVLGLRIRDRAFHYCVRRITDTGIPTESHLSAFRLAYKASVEGKHRKAHKLWNSCAGLYPKRSRPKSLPVIPPAGISGPTAKWNHTVFTKPIRPRWYTHLGSVAGALRPVAPVNAERAQRKQEKAAIKAAKKAKAAEKAAKRPKPVPVRKTEFVSATARANYFWNKDRGKKNRRNRRLNLIDNPIYDYPDICSDSEFGFRPDTSLNDKFFALNRDYLDAISEEKVLEWLPKIVLAPDGASKQ